MFEEHGPVPFLLLAEELKKLSLEGKLIWWAFEFCGEDTTRFMEEVRNRNPEMLKHAHKQASVYSCFAGTTEKSHQTHLERK